MVAARQHHRRHRPKPHPQHRSAHHSSKEVAAEAGVEVVVVVVEVVELHHSPGSRHRVLLQSRLPPADRAVEAEGVEEEVVVAVDSVPRQPR